MTSQLECDTGGGQTSLCTLTLAAPAGYKITLTSGSCDALNTEIRLTSPVTATLTTDACQEPVGTVWDYSTPINPAGPRSTSKLTPTSSPARRDCGVTGAYPTWSVNFEDGSTTTDFNARGP